MRGSMVTVAVLATVAVLVLARCGGNGGNADGGGAGADATVSGLDGQVAAQDGAVADAATAGLDAAAAGTDASTATGDAGTLTATTCAPFYNYGCDAGLCFTTAISQMGVESTACGEPGALLNYAACDNTLSGQCQAGSTCVLLEADAGMVCHQFCTPNVACPGTETAPEKCQAPNGTALVGYCVNVEACSLYTQNCTSASEGCYPVSSGAGGCVSKGNKKAGDACTLHADCSPGLVCPSGAGGSVCRAACDPAAADTCTGGMTCTKPNAQTWGFCM